MPDNETALTYNKSPVSEQGLITLRGMDLDAGLLGKFFGGPKVSPLNIAGLLSILLVVCGLIFTFWKGVTDSTDYWKLAMPVVTLSLGYLFGKKT